jgi:flagellar basal-body rod protein FlgB
MVGKLDEALRFHEVALSLRAQRQQLLASNIANGDTPNYKARDFDFSKALENALSNAGSTPADMAKTAPAHMDPAGGGELAGAPLLYRTEPQGSIDGNTVDVDAERNQFADNGIRYEASLTMINAQIRNLLAAIQG